MKFGRALSSIVAGTVIGLGISESARGAVANYDNIPVDSQSQNLVYNGEFRENADGWELINHNPANWQSRPGWNGEAGYFFVNHFSGYKPETNQLITDLVPGKSYIVSGYFRRDTQNHPNPNFEVLLDKDVYFSAGGKMEDGWTRFKFDYLADCEKILLRFQSQVTGDDAYDIDNISFNIIPEPSTIGIVGAGLLLASRRKK